MSASSRWGSALQGGQRQRALVATRRAVPTRAEAVARECSPAGSVRVARRATHSVSQFISSRLCPPTELTRIILFPRPPARSVADIEDDNLVRLDSVEDEVLPTSSDGLHPDNPAVLRSSDFGK